MTIHRSAHLEQAHAVQVAVDRYRELVIELLRRAGHVEAAELVRGAQLVERAEQSPTQGLYSNHIHGMQWDGHRG